MLAEFREMICQYVDVEPEKVTEDARFMEDLGFNSYDFMSLVGEVEEKYDIEVEEREVVQIKTVKDAMDYISQEPTNSTDKPKTVEFKPYQPKYRKRGTGSVHQVSKNVWEGRYTPTVNGKRIARNIYADSEEECEVKLEALIKEMKAELGIK